MTEQYETWVERQIREARERGEFDNLPGTGKPLDLSDADDPDWWVKRKLKAEGIELSATGLTVMSLRRERATFPESLLSLATEESVRAVLEDYNRRVRQDRLRPVLGRSSPVIAGLVDVDEMTERWRALKDQERGRSS